MSFKNLIITLSLSILPISELRGAIPFAFACGIPLNKAAIISIAGNIMVAPLTYIFLDTLHKVFYKWSFYSGLFDRFVEKARLKVHNKIALYGYLGLALFIAIPLPITGAWTGVLGAWILGMDKKKVILAATIGVLISGIIVTMVLYFGLEVFSLFIKHI